MATPPSYWWLSAVAFLFFWFVFGAVAMYFSWQVGARLRTGDRAGAAQASRLARQISIAGIAVGTLIYIVIAATG